MVAEASQPRIPGRYWQLRIKEPPAGVCIAQMTVPCINKPVVMLEQTLHVFQVFKRNAQPANFGARLRWNAKQDRKYEGSQVMNYDPQRNGRLPTRRSLVELGLLVLLCSLPFAAKAGQNPAPLPSDSISTGSVARTLEGQQSALQSSGTISGRVIDQSGSAVGGARVTLTREGDSQNREVTTDDDGRFAFADVAPGLVQVTVTSEGLASQTLYEPLDVGQTYIIPDITLAIATQMTEVHVGVTPAELAQDEVKAEEKQRMFGVIPNFFVTYESHPVPLTTKLKFELARKSASDPFTLGAVGAVAGIEQAGNQWRGYGQGVGGYAKRYGASYGDVFVGTFIGSAALPSLLKQDPRYFYQGKGSKRSRFLHAFKGAVICRGDNGRSEPNYSNIGGAFATGALANLYYPASQRNGARVVVSTALIRIGETAVANVFQEFFVAKVTPSLRTRSSTQP